MSLNAAQLFNQNVQLLMTVALLHFWSGVGKEVVFDNFTTNWYWLINNLNLFDFVFDPPGTNHYVKLPNEQAMFESEPIKNLSY